MRRRAFIGAGVSLLSASSAAAESAKAPTFEAYPATDVWRGAAAAPQTTTPFAESYRALLFAASRQPANFAGRNRLTTWAARNGCFRGAAIDLKTGTIAFLPLTLCDRTRRTASYTVTFRLDSRLITISDPKDGAGQPLTRYFVFDGSTFSDVTKAGPEAKPSPSPDELAKIPDAPAKAPDAPAKTADAPAKTADAPAKTADAPAKTADAPAKTADAPARTPDSPAKAPNAPVKPTKAEDQAMIGAPAEPSGIRQNLTFNACGSTWGYFIDGTNQPYVSLLFEGLDKGPTLVLHVKDGATTNELNGDKDRGPWNLDLTVPPFGGEAISRIAYSGRLIYLSIAFTQSASNKLILTSFGFNDTGKPCPTRP